MEKEDDYYMPYASTLATGKTLLETMKIPRPCAFSSFNMTAVQYYRGQKTLTYDVLAQNDARVASGIKGNPDLVYQDGTDASDLLKYNG